VKSYVGGLLVTNAVVILIAALLARWCHDFHVDNGFYFRFAMIAAGPIGGWVQSSLDGAMVTAIWSLLPLTALAIGPLVFAAKCPSVRVPCFAAAAIFWLLSGLFYGIAIWV
jgi:hypothetical protein